jgi:tetratricopeptide (TPR) repeat protein
LFLAYQQQDESIVEAERTLALNPSFLPTYIALSWANWTAGRPEKAIEHADTALRRGPHDPVAYAFLREKGYALFSLSRYEEAAKAFRESVAINPDLPITSLLLVASLSLAGHDADARETLQRYLALPAGAAKSIAQIKDRQPFETPFAREVYQRVCEGLRKAGMPES